MRRSFENYLIMVGIRSLEFTYTDKELFSRRRYFRQCYKDNLSAYKALVFLWDKMEEEKTHTEKGSADPS